MMKLMRILLARLIWRVALGHMPLAARALLHSPHSWVRVTLGRLAVRCACRLVMLARRLAPELVRG